MSPQHSEGTLADRATRDRRDGDSETAELLRDPDAALQRARDAAWNALNRRDRTELELRALLANKRAEPAAIEQVVRELFELGYLDDDRYARRFAEDRRNLDGWGAERIERKLTSLGVDRAVIAAAVEYRDPADELDAAIALLRVRFPSPLEDDKTRSRALGMLRRRGYDSDTAYEALRLYGREL